MKLKEIKYQEESIAELLRLSDFYLPNNKKKLNNHKTQLLLQAFTGAGKTVIMSQFVKGFIESPIHIKEKTAFIFMTPGKGELKNQSYKSFNNFIGELPNLDLLVDDQLTSVSLDKNTVIFSNWEMAKKGNIYKDSETSSIFNLVQDSHFDNLVMIIDESHYAKTSELSSDVIEKFSPDLIVNVSATPINEQFIDSNGNKASRFNDNNTVKVEINDIISEGIIKKKIFVNPGLADLETDTILKAAISKQEDINKEINRFGLTDQLKEPLIMIQVQNDSKVNNVAVEKGGNITRIKEALIEAGMGEEFIGVYSSGKANQKYRDENLKLEDIQNSDMKALIFKQGVDLGVDIPRAHILVKLRDVKSASFDIQVTGRIMRTQTKEHFNNELIDNAYIFNQYDTNSTNWTKLNYLVTEGKLVQDQNIESTSIKSADSFADPKLAEKYLGLLTDIPTTFSKTHLSIENVDLKIIRESFIETFSDYVNDFSEDAIILNNEYIAKMQSGSGNVEDYMNNLVESDTTIESADFIESLYKMKINEYIKTLPKGDEVSINKALNSILNKVITDEYGEGHSIMSFVANNQKLITGLFKAVDKLYRQKTGQESRSVIDTTWTVPEEVVYSSQSERPFSQRYLYEIQPDLSKEETGSTSEEIFKDVIEYNREDNVLFWFKQMESKENSFSISVKKQYERLTNSNFYPDFIFVTESGKLVILDTKSPKDVEIDVYAEDNKHKLVGMREWLTKNKESLIQKGFSDVEFELVRYDKTTQQFYVTPEGEDYTADGSNLVVYETLRY